MKTTAEKNIRKISPTTYDATINTLLFCLHHQTTTNSTAEQNGTKKKNKQEKTAFVGLVF